MILSCPNCATQYTVKDALLGIRGRTVRCAACKSTWHAETPIDLRYSEPKTKQDEDDEPEEDLRTVKAKKLPGKYRAMLEDKKRMKALAVEGMVWGGLASLAIAILALGYFLRVDIVRAFPRIAGAYAMVGMDVKGTNLRFVTYTADSAVKGGRFVVTVKAQVKNISDQPTPVPPVRVKLLDSTLQQFSSVLMPSGDLVVGPNATRTLTFDVADPKNQVASIDLGFDMVAMKAMKDHPARKPHAAVTTIAEADPASEAMPEHGTEAPGPADSDVSGPVYPEETSLEPTQPDQQALSTQPAHDLRPALPASPSSDHSTR